MKSRNVLLTTIALLGLLLSSAAFADKGGWRDRDRSDDDSSYRSRGRDDGRSYDRGSRAGTSLDDAVGQVRRSTGARILSAGSVNEGGRTVHRIRILTPEGRVKTLEVDGGR